MSMSGKTFLAAFQVGSRLVPDEIDRRVSRKKTNLQKDLLEIEKKAKDSEKIRRTEGVKSYNDWDREIKELDKDSPFFPRQYADITSKYIGGISLWPQAYTRYENTDNAIKEDARFKGKVDAVNELVVVNDWWNKTNKGDPVNIFEVDDAKRIEINKAYKDHIKEEKKEELTSKLITEGEVKSQLENQAKFTTFLQKTGSPYKPEDFNKPEAQNAMRRNDQLEEVRDLAVEAGRDGIPIVKRLTLKEDGTGYSNVFDVKVELQEIIDKKKTDRANKGKSLTESQGNAFSYSERMRYDNRIIDQMKVKGLVPEEDILQELLSKWGQDDKVDFFNVVVEPKYRQFKTAADNFIRAVLRKESGAAISESEYKGAFRDYIPRAGDDKATVEQKRNLRLGVTNVMRRISSIPWDDGEGIPLQPLQFEDREQAQRYFDLGYVEPGDLIEVKTTGGWQPMKFESKPKKKP